MDNTLNLLFELSGSAIENKVLSDGISSMLTADKTEALYKLAKQQDLAHIVSLGLYKNNITNIDPKLKTKFLNSQISSVMRYEQQKFELERICCLFEDNKIKFMPLKGAVIRSLYPEEWMRTSCDIDVLIKESDCDIAIKLLCDNADYTYKAKGFHDYKLVSKSGVNLELHYDLIEEREIPEVKEYLSSIWSRATLKKGYGFYYEMPAETFMLYHIAHMAKHFKIGGCGIRPFIDLWLLSRKMSYNNEVLVKDLKDTLLYPFYAACKELAEVWFGGAEHTQLTRSMQEYIIDGRLYGSLDNNIAVSRTRGETGFKYFLKVIFLPRKSLELIYPDLKNKPILMPFYQVRRWFGVFSTDKRRKVKRLADANTSVSSQRLADIDSLFSQLRLK